MAQEMTMQEIAAAGAAAQADIDKHLSKAYHAAQRLAHITEEGVKAGMITKAIAAKMMLADARVLPGLIANAALHAANLHRGQTDACIRNNCDIPTPSEAGGVVIQGGGGR